MSEPADLRCPRCRAAVEAGQEYCLECGGRLGQETPGRVERVSAGVVERHPWARPWVVPALLGLVIAVAGTIAAIAISSDGDDQGAVSVATGGSLTATNDQSTLTAPEPSTAPTATETAPPPTTTSPPPPPVNPATVEWPSDRKGWTIVLLSLPQANGRDAAEAKAKQAREGGLRRVGVLDSSRFASLHPGYYVVFTGIFDTEAEAASALQRARAVFGTAYQRQITP
jgi:hypothetical protein